MIPTHDRIMGVWRRARDVTRILARRCHCAGYDVRKVHLGQKIGSRENSADPTETSCTAAN